MRVHELARDLGVDSGSVLEKAYELRIAARSASSQLAADEVERLRGAFGDHRNRIGVRGERSSEGWRSGAVKEPKDPQLLAEIQRMCNAFPTMREHRESLRMLGSQIVYAGYCKDARFSECAVALVRFSGAIEAAFGLTREVLFFYSPHPDTQIRTYDAARRAIGAVPREVTPDMLFFYSRDVRLKQKLDDWSTGGFMAIPLMLSDPSDPISFITLLRDYIFSRDLFYETTPVHGDKFFGRRTLLQGLRDDILNQRVAGVYGLRKAGKTSVLTQIRSQLETGLHRIVLQDLENLPSPPVDPVPDLLVDLRSRIQASLREAKLPTGDLAQLESAMSLVSFKLAMNGVLSALDKRGARLTLMLDEIEYLTPADGIDIREGQMPAIAQFLGTLRSLVQENRNFTFILSGLTSAITESGRLYGRPNPLFSWAKAYFIAPLDRGEADEMSLSIGGRMGVQITRSALRSMHEASGGHAFLYRHLASHAVRQLPLEQFSRELDGPDVQASLSSWRRLVAGNIREMRDHVARYYPDEAFLLDVLSSDPDLFPQLADENPLAVGHLISLGLIREEGRDFELSPVLELL